uniref:Uncharacterized protein n=1 Tax=uncultured marine virus TaxID=186617 RepID=A0A0F7L409_9VIRU|nr:hypothetical protein [uncultured marine virus]
MLFGCLCMANSQVAIYQGFYLIAHFHIYTVPYLRLRTIQTLIHRQHTRHQIRKCFLAFL